MIRRGRAVASRRPTPGAKSNGATVADHENTADNRGIPCAMPFIGSMIVCRIDPGNFENLNGKAIWDKTTDLPSCRILVLNDKKTLEKAG